MTSDVETILEREEAFTAALLARDADAAGGVLADDYALELVRPVLTVVERAEWLRTLDLYVVHVWHIEERAVSVDGDVATVLMRVAMEATVGGVDRSGPFVITDVWRRQDDGEWRVWRRHSTPLEAGAMPRTPE